MATNRPNAGHWKSLAAEIGAETPVESASDSAAESTPPPAAPMVVSYAPPTRPERPKSATKGPSNWSQLAMSLGLEPDPADVASAEPAAAFLDELPSHDAGGGFEASREVEFDEPPAKKPHAHQSHTHEREQRPVVDRPLEQRAPEHRPPARPVADRPPSNRGRRDRENELSSESRRDKPNRDRAIRDETPIDDIDDDVVIDIGGDDDVIDAGATTTRPEGDEPTRRRRRRRGRRGRRRERDPNETAVGEGDSTARSESNNDADDGPDDLTEHAQPTEFLEASGDTEGLATPGSAGDKTGDEQRGRGRRRRRRGRGSSGERSTERSTTEPRKPAGEREARPRKPNSERGERDRRGSRDEGGSRRRSEPDDVVVDIGAEFDDDIDFVLEGEDVPLDLPTRRTRDDELDEDHGGDDGDEGEDGEEGVKMHHRNIPSWEEAIGSIVATNMEARAKSPQQSGQRGRGRGGQRRGGRGRGDNRR